jgi:lipoyl-dependent peroxiredoxin
MAESRAEAVWQGDLLSGRGTVSAASGALRDQPVTWSARVERTPDTTSPEELLAAAHAACFAMAFSHALAQAGSPAERLEVRATVAFEEVEDGFAVTRSELSVQGTAPGLNEQRFAELAEQAGQGCPVSKALEGNVEISVQPVLAAL